MCASTACSATSRRDPVSDRLREAGWNVTEASTIEVPELPVTTVYFGPAEGEQAAAEAVGKILGGAGGSEDSRIAEQPPGVIVLVTG